MAPVLGFVLVTHAYPEQIIYLCNDLSKKFGNAPIALHHDFGQSSLPRADLPANVSIVEDWIPTGWGELSIVKAMFLATNLLFRVANPDWCISLSAADYPIKSAQHILHQLQTTSSDVFLDYREIQRKGLPENYARPHVDGTADAAWTEYAYERYVATPVIPHRIATTLNIPNDRFRARGPLATKLLTPYSKNFKPYGGDAWITFNRRAAGVLTEPSRLQKKLFKHYERRYVPDESFYQTVLCNRSDLKIENKNYRYTDWSLGEPHPKTLGREDIPALLASDAHFARKFPFDPGLFREIDEQVAATL